MREKDDAKRQEYYDTSSNQKFYGQWNVQKKNELRDLNDSITHKIPTILQPASQVMYDMMIVLEARANKLGITVFLSDQLCFLKKSRLCPTLHGRKGY